MSVWALDRSPLRARLSCVPHSVRAALALIHLAHDGHAKFLLRNSMSDMGCKGEDVDCKVEATR